MARLFNTAYYSVKMNVSYKNHENIVNLQRENGLDMGKSLFSEKAVKDMVKHMSTIMKSRLLQKVKESNLDISVMVDESTSVRQNTCLVIYIRIFFNNKGRNYFWELKELKETTSNAIANSIEMSLSLFGEEYLKKHWIGLATDGASNLRGHRSGAATQLQFKYKRLVIIHCLAHR